ncbi:MAG: RpiB/LacA/LacB family sugar-phosphate isomerase, partial [Clostridia bacterium]
MKIAIGCDHGGFILKAAVVEQLKKMNVEVLDFGTDSDESVDYPIYAEKVAEA